MALVKNLCQRVRNKSQNPANHSTPNYRQESIIVMKALNPATLAAQFGAYSHGTEIPAGKRIVRTSGQLAIQPNGFIPQGAYEQATLCFQSISAILDEAGMTASDVAHISAYVTDRQFMADYMRARDEFVGGAARLPSSTLVIVSGFTRPEFKVEVEVLAAA